MSENIYKPPEPLIIPPDQHPITEKQIDRDAFYVLKKLNQAGYSSYLVGGGVRDLYLGKKPKDFDVCTDARPGQIRRLFPGSRIIGRRFRLVQVFFGRRKVIEVATLRSVNQSSDDHKAVLAPNNTFGTLDQDAIRRDLTINSLFYEIENHTIIDYAGGVKDLDSSVIRFIGEPSTRIRRDPVRMLRAVRHAARNNFPVEKNSWEAICNLHHTLALCPPSRLRDELLKDLYSGFAGNWFALADKAGIFAELLTLYQPLFASQKQDQTAIREELTSIFAVIDRINNYCVANGLSRPTDSFLMALILLPWAIRTHHLLEVALKGPDRFKLSLKIKDDLDHKLSTRLNLRRFVRQKMLTLLINLPFMIHHKRKGFWPKWLKKKSYFRSCSFFYSYYLEAYQQRPMPDIIIDEKSIRKKKGLDE